jgi:hypothetical protein
MALLRNQFDKPRQPAEDEEHDEEYYYNLQFKTQKRNPDEPQPETGNPHIKKKHRPVVIQTEEEPGDQEELIETAAPPKRRKTNDGIQMDAVGCDEVIASKITVTISPSTSHSTKKMKLTTELPIELYERFRNYRFKSRKSNIQIFSEWIEANCPE